MIKITESAKEKILSILAEDNADKLRFGLKGGGCTGFTYYLAIEDQQADDDLIFPLDDSHVLLVDPMSNMYLEGAEVDYKVDIMGQSFVFNNPNTTSKCGCGSSVGF